MTYQRNHYQAADHIQVREWLALAFILGTTAAGVIGLIWLIVWLLVRALR